jgi:hypothetical protein
MCARRYSNNAQEDQVYLKQAMALAVLLGSMGITCAVQAAGMKTYTNKKHGYSLQYPANWTRTPHAYQQDVAFTAPDTNAIVTASATAGNATPAEVKAQQAKVLKGMGKAQGALSDKLVSIHGVTYQLSEIVTKTPQGKVLDVVLLDTVHGAYLYDFEVFLLYNGPTYKAETTTVQHMLKSITLAQ